MRIAVVGAGFSGATLAYLLGKVHKVIVFEKEPVVGGACYTERDPETGIMLHKYGPHIFHTKNPRIRDFVQQFGKWYPFNLRMKSFANNQIFSGPPINLHTINQFYNTRWRPAEAETAVTASEKREFLTNFEEAAIEKVGVALYETFLKYYTEKQWGRPATDIPVEVFNRLPIRFSYDDSKYLENEWQAIPEEGYTVVVQRMLRDAIVLDRTPFSRDQASTFDHVFYTGPLDAWFDFDLGRLEYRTVDFEIDTIPERDVQGAPVICYPGPKEEIPHTRITEHKHFTPWEFWHTKSVLYKEISRQCRENDRPFYPVRLSGSTKLLDLYQERMANETNVTFLGRLGTFRYLDMDQAIAEAIKIAREFLQRWPSS